MRKMEMLVSLVVALGLATAGPATEPGLSPPPTEACTHLPMEPACAG